MDELFNQLRRPFPVNRIHWRAGATTRDKSKCIPLAYIDARDVMDRLDQLFPLTWQDRYSHVADGLVICEIGLPVGEHGGLLWRANGAGDTQVEAEKGKLSDAFKRAAVMWGIGRYLYSLPNVWVPYNQQARKPEQIPELPAWATPEGYDQLLAKRQAA